MKLVITIKCDNSAFNGNDRGRELARLDRTDREAE